MFSFIVITQGWCRSSRANLLRTRSCFTFSAAYAAFYQFSYSAHHLPGVSNVAADALSRGNMSLFFSFFHRLSLHGSPWRYLSCYCLGLGVAGLDRAVQEYLMTSLSPNTLRSYRSAVDGYIQFCRCLGLSSHFPAIEPVLAQFAAFLAAHGLACGSIRVYLSGIRFAQISLGLV